MQSKGIPPSSCKPWTSTAEHSQAVIGRVHRILLGDCPLIPGSSGTLFPGDLINAIDGKNICAAAISEISEMLVGPPNSAVRLTVERGQRYPYTFAYESSARKGQYRAPSDAFYLEIFKGAEPLGIELDAAAAIAAQGSGGETVRDIHDIAHDGKGPQPKVIKAVKPEVKSEPPRAPALKLTLGRGLRRAKGLLLMVACC